MSRWLKILPLTLALAALSILAASCNSASPAQVRFVNAIQDTDQYGAALDIEFNGTRDFSDVAFFGYLPISGYTSVPLGSDTIEGLETATSTEIFDANVSLNPGTQSQYTIVATGFAINSSKIAIISAADNNTAPVAGKVEFRVINASPSGPSGVDIYIVPVGSSGSIAPPPTIANLAYRGVSGYVALPYNSNRVDGANYTMFVTATGTTAPILITQSLSAGSSSEGSIRTLVLTDQQNIDQLNPLAIVLNDFN
jgi:hypothetical protein